MSELDSYTLEKAQEEEMYYSGQMGNDGIWKKPQKMSETCADMIVYITSHEEPFMPDSDKPNPWISGGKASGGGGGGGGGGGCVIL